ncbi:MAG: alpha/beta fold hydrolase [Holophagae bacterium]|jgi:pimeloyl-ACP methyl ester carboxylesterase
MPTVHREGISIYFEETGSGPAVVLGHSFLCSGEMWANQVGPLAERYRVINIDQRGHGRSSPCATPFSLYDMVDDVAAVLDSLEIDRAVWAGLSIGGMVAMRAALVIPDRVRALIIVDSHAGSETTFKKLKYGAMNLGATVLGLRPFVPAVLPLMFGATTMKEQPELVRHWGDRFGDLHRPSVSATLQALVRRDSVAGKLAQITVSSLVLAGEEDRSLPPALSKEIADGLVDAELLTIAEAGHLSALERPVEVTAAMLSFLDGLT